MDTEHSYAQKRVLIAAPEILAIPVKECGETLVDMRAVGGIKVNQSEEMESRQSHYALVRQTVADKLLEVQRSLPQGLTLRLNEGCRSLESQQQEFDEELSQVRERNPEYSKDRAFVEATKIVSPVINLDGSKNIPPHSTGGAVDVEIIDDQGKVLDYGMEIADWARVAPALCETHNEEISTKARENRLFLFQIMLKAGFANYYTEWWHYSYGDRYWAFQYNQDHAIYGSV